METIEANNGKKAAENNIQEKGYKSSIGILFSIISVFFFLLVIFSIEASAEHIIIFYKFEWFPSSSVLLLLPLHVRDFARERENKWPKRTIKHDLFNSHLNSLSLNNNSQIEDYNKRKKKTTWERPQKKTGKSEISRGCCECRLL
jgi:hypothetical protein